MIVPLRHPIAPSKIMMAAMMITALFVMTTGFYPKHNLIATSRKCGMPLLATQSEEIRRGTCCTYDGMKDPLLKP